jgi:hypothetical protein
MKHLAAVGFMAAIVASAVCLFAQPSGPRRDGNWEITIEMQMPNMPAGMTMPPIKTTQCISKEDAADPNRLVPPRAQRGGGERQDCKVSDYKSEGNKVSYKITCTGAQPVTGTGEIIYGTDSYTGTMTMNMERGGQAMVMTQKMTGKRLGDCNK